MSASGRELLRRTAVLNATDMAPDAQVKFLRGLCSAHSGLWVEAEQSSYGICEIELYGLLGIGRTAEEAARRWLRDARTAIQIDEARRRAA